MVVPPTAITMNFKPKIHATRHADSPVRRGCLHRVVLLIPLLMAVLMIPACGLLGTAVSLGITKLQFGCLPEGTLIDTTSGPMKIESLRSGDRIVGFDGETVHINQIHQYREDPETSRYITFHFSNGSTLSTSPRHRIDGVQASMIQVGDSCGAAKVIRIEDLRGVARSFDLLTDDTGYRIAGIPVNSMIGEMAGSTRLRNRPVGIR